MKNKKNQKKERMFVCLWVCHREKWKEKEKKVKDLREKFETFGGGSAWDSVC